MPRRLELDQRTDLLRALHFVREPVDGLLGLAQVHALHAFGRAEPQQINGGFSSHRHFPSLGLNSNTCQKQSKHIDSHAQQ